MAEALEKVKKDLGRSAVILHTRTIRKGGLMGVGARTVVEITASRDANLLPKAERQAIIGRMESLPDARPSRPVPVSARPTAPSQAEGAAVPPRNSDVVESGKLDEISASTSALRGELTELRAMVRSLLDRPLFTSSGPAPGALVSSVPSELQDYYTKLIQNAVADELASEVIARAKERVTEWQARLEAAGQAEVADIEFQRLIPDALTDCIERMLPPAEPVQLDPEAGTVFVAMVGPTGVGKTTTIAKLAAQFKLRDRRRVGLITTDTYRIAAVEQLRAYADILGLPLEVVYTPAELAAAVQRMQQDHDVVLIDTSGRSHRDSDRLGDLRAFLDAARAAIAVPDPAPAGTEADRTCERPARLEIHLVLSCTSQPSQTQDVVRNFAPLGVERVVFTKLDEAVGVGVLLNLAHRLEVRLSYLTMGQDVPDDIEVGNRRRIAEMMLRGEPATEMFTADAPRRGASLVNHLA